MPSFIHTANGTKTVFRCLPSALPKTVRVDGIVTVPQATSANSVTLAGAPLGGVSVEIMYGEIRAVVDRTPGTPATQSGGAGVTLGGPASLRSFGVMPLPTVVNSAQSIAPPVVNYRDDLAENVVFVLDPNAGEIDVLGDGRITVSRK